MTPFHTLQPGWVYLTLRAALHARDGVRASHAGTATELTTWWACSGKTARRHLARLGEEGRVNYAPGRGRGNTSRLTFSADLREELEALTEALAGQGMAGELARLSRLPFPRAWVLTEAARGVFGLGEARPGVDRLRTVYTRDLTSLDPLHASATMEAHLLAQVLDPLVHFDPDTGAAAPHLAHHWNPAEDGLRWTFHLRKGVAFHHGRTLDAGDVRATLERVQAGAAWFLPGLEAVEEAGPYAVRLHLSRPDAFLPRRLADTQALILPRDVPFDEARPVGTGAFCWTPLEGGFRLSAFDAHFAGRPLIDEVEFYRVDHRDQITLLDVTGENAEAHRDTWQAEVGVQFLIWNGHRPAARGPFLRAAICELHDVAAYWRETGQAAPLIPATSFYPRRSAGQPLRHRSEEQAAKRLRASGYAGEPLFLWALPWAEPLAEAHWLAERAARHGIKLEVRPSELVEDPSGEADLLLMGEVAGADEHLAFWTAMRQPERSFRRLLPPDVLNALDGALDGYRAALSFEEREAPFWTG
ncbi:ABC transporter substrate-binding protein [Deinococcus hopiensis]|uniref:ABC transporter substrate-binding protein n=1 Tax=Deinococcus hopiensis TaxID=309885 RepID=UPI0009FEB1B0|nr:ABC transporter substrate-binding protein [Deinococcus hopiensis]